MAKICPVCGNSVSFLTMVPRQGFKLHLGCIKKFHRNPEKYGGSERVHKTHKQKVEDKSVYVKGFNMPFEEMVIFMVKCALASIPAFIILAIIGGIFFAIFGSLFF